MKKIKSLVDLIGNTPIVQAKNLDTGKCNLFLKMESLNPGSSIKDRVALRIIEDAEAQGKLKKGSTVVEATAGNTGLGLALIALLKGNNLDINLGLNSLGEAMFATFEYASSMLEAFGDTLNSGAKTDRYYAYANYRLELFKDRLFIQPGMRYVQYGINNEAYLLPRFGVSLLPARGWTIRFGGGTYIQSQ